MRSKHTAVVTLQKDQGNDGAQPPVRNTRIFLVSFKAFFRPLVAAGSICSKKDKRKQKTPTAIAANTPRGHRRDR